MEGSRIPSAFQAERRAEQTCSQCGRTFLPHSTTEAADELCDICYEVEFAPAGHSSKRNLAARRAGGDGR